MASNNPFNCQRAFLVVTGASRGIGRAIAIEFSRSLPPDSVCLLLAGSESGLQATKAEAVIANPNIRYYYKSMDLTKPDKEELNIFLKDCLGAEEPSCFDQAIIVHNVGSVGDLKERAVDMGEHSKWQDYFSLNVFSVAVFNTVFLKMFTSVAVNNRLVVNITSICGLQPKKSMGYYCCGKAAREMYFKVLALEEDNLTVLNYAPGPVATDMFDEIAKNSGDSEIQRAFTEMKDKKIVLTSLQTTTKLVGALKKGNYVSGDHLDYYDIND